MSWLDSITPNFMLSEDRRIQKEQRRVTNRDLQPEDREAAYKWLAENGSGKALVALLSRFDMKLEHQMKDGDEKEYVFGLLLAHGAEKVERPVRAHLRRCKTIAMPLRLLAELKGDREAVEMAFELLDAERARDDFKPEKKIDLLVWLVDHKHERAVEVVSPFLQDFDEGVRFAAAEVLIAQQQDDRVRPLLEAVIANPKEESNRLRIRLYELFQRKGWKLERPEAVSAAATAGWQVIDGRLAAGR